MQHAQQEQLSIVASAAVIHAHAHLSKHLVVETVHRDVTDTAQLRHRLTPHLLVQGVVVALPQVTKGVEQLRLQFSSRPGATNECARRVAVVVEGV